MIANGTDNVLDKWIADSIARTPVLSQTTSPQVYRRSAIAQHRTWVAVVSAGATLMLAVPAVSQQASLFSSALVHWVGFWSTRIGL